MRRFKHEFIWEQIEVYVFRIVPNPEQGNEVVFSYALGYPLPNFVFIGKPALLLGAIEKFQPLYFFIQSDRVVQI